MKVAASALGVLFLLPACVEEPTPKDAEKAVEAVEQDEVEATQLSIEQAAEEATKIIEADAKEEADSAAISNSQ